MHLMLGEAPVYEFLTNREYGNFVALSSMFTRSINTWYAFSCLNLTLTVGPLSFVVPFAKYVPAVPLCPPAFTVLTTVAMIDFTVPVSSGAICVGPASSEEVKVLSNVFFAINSPISVPLMFQT